MLIIKLRIDMETIVDSWTCSMTLNLLVLRIADNILLASFDCLLEFAFWIDCNSQLSEIFEQLRNIDLYSVGAYISRNYLSYSNC